jgi:hypothetical protein
VIALAIAGCDAGGRTAVPVAAPWNATPRSVVDTEALFGALGALEEAERLGDPARARAVLADEVVLVACGRVRSWRRDDRGALAALTAATRLAEPGVKAWDATLATDSGMAWVTSVAGAAAAPVRRLDVLVRRGDGWALVAEALVPDPSTRDAVCAGLAAIAGGAPAIDRSAPAPAGRRPRWPAPPTTRPTRRCAACATPTRTGSSTSRTSAPTSPRPSTATTTRMAAPTRAG